jgi:hypothetical protein
MGIISETYKALHKQDDRYFRTTSLHLASVLFARGFTLVNVDRTDPEHCQFVFRDSFDLQELASRFSARKAILVDAHKFIFCSKLLRRKLAGEPF